LALLFYAGVFIYLAIDYRKLRGTDAKSVAYQNEVEARIKEMPFAGTKKDHAKILVMGMCACLFLFLITAVNISRHAK
jgi:hypothetical protein